MNGTALVRNKIDELIWNSRREFAKRRWILLTNVQEGTSVEDLKQNFLQGLNVIDFRINKNSAYMYVLLATPDQALNAVNTLNGETFRGYVVGVCLAPPDSLVFVGNLPFEFTEEQFRNLMSPFGPIERLVLVRSFFTGESKGYGFVDYLNRECATQAKKQLTRKGSKYLGGRIIRVDVAEGNLLTYEDLHSKTLFVDRLPRDLTNADMLRDLFTQSGTVTFAQVALNQRGISRGFAFVDYMTAEEAERGQKAHNGALLINSYIRVAYGTPGRTGASILGGGVPPVAKEPTQQFTAQGTIPALMGDSVLGGGLAQATVDPGVFGQPVQPIAPQQQEVFSPQIGNLVCSCNVMTDTTVEDFTSFHLQKLKLHDDETASSVLIP